MLPNDGAAPDSSPADYGAPFEKTLPEWQQWVNGFCENWIFAFLIAMAIRHFMLEPFVIPTASMEPMLYGDPGFMKGDHVVVDKIRHRLQDPKRFDVTVFQVPQPELYNGKMEARPGRAADGSSLAVPLWDPLIHRNFVKRILVMPNEDWYVHNGDVYVRSGSAPFAVVVKPDDLQRHVWLECYRSGGQAGYLPWTGPVTDTAGILQFQAGRSTFTQRLTNLYVKPGRVKFGPIGTKATVVLPMADQPPVSMTAPLIPFEGTLGSIWDMDRWEVRRMNTADLDSQSHGTLMNPLMQEMSGDWRWRIGVTSLTGTAAVRMLQPLGVSHALELFPGGWRLLTGQEVVASGNDSPSTHNLALARVDGQLLVEVNQEIRFRQAVAPWTPLQERPLQMWVEVSDSMRASLGLDRDIHYSQRFLDGESLDWETEGTQRISFYDQAMGALQNSSSPETAAFVRQYLRMRLPTLRRLVPESPWPSDGELMSCGIEELRMMMDLARSRARRVGVSPETALHVPDGAYAMLGDNSPHSLDSRAWGYVPVTNMRGRTLAVVLPWGRWRVIR